MGGKSMSIGIQKKTLDFIGKKFHRLLILGITARHDNPKNGRVAWADCKCDCGLSFTTRLASIKNNMTKSCGCLQKELVTTHGYSKHERTESLCLYQIWSGIKQRCFNKNTRDYFRYGGRGILMSSEWKDSFNTFLKDMGPRPSNKHSIDRIENNQGYSKDNCRWADKKQQAQNTSYNIRISFGSAERNLSYWCELFGMPHATALSRIRKDGLTPQQALTKPTRLQKKRCLKDKILRESMFETRS